MYILTCEMNAELGVVSIKVETYVRMILNNFPEWSSAS